jgi:signal transduction histidine kinase
VGNPYSKLETLFHSWPAITIMVIATQVGVSFLIKSQAILIVYVVVSCLSLLFLVAGMTAKKGVGSKRVIRMFWSWLTADRGRLGTILAILSIPVMGVWELFRIEDPLETRASRWAILFVDVLALIVLAFMRVYADRDRLTAQLSDVLLRKTKLEKECRELCGRLIRAQELERSRIGRELHDDLNQQVALLAFGLTQLSKRLPTQKMGNEVRRLLAETERLSEDVHRLSHELHSSVLDHLGLAAAARTLCQEVSRQQNVTVRFTEEHFPAELPPEVSLCLFRILQEALNNTCKHSHGSFAQVTLIGTPEGVHLKVQDDGIGFDPVDKCNRCGLGLLSMSERLCLVGGNLVIDSAPSQGTTVCAWVPMKSAEIPRDALASEQPETFARPGIAGANDGTNSGSPG